MYIKLLGNYIDAQKMRNEVLQKLARFLLVVLIAIILMRLYALGLFYFLRKFVGENSQLAKQIVDDPWHHYQIGIVLMILGFIFHKRKTSFVLSAIGLGIFLEEWAVFLSDLGFMTNQLYATKLDFIGIMAIIAMFYMLTKLLIWRRSLRA